MIDNTLGCTRKIERVDGVKERGGENDSYVEKEYFGLLGCVVLRTEVVPYLLTKSRVFPVPHL